MSDAAATPGASGRSLLNLRVHSLAACRQRIGGMTVHHGRIESPFGPALLGFSEEGICLLQFPLPESDDQAIIARYLPGARTRVDRAGARRRGAGLFDPHRTAPVDAWAAGTPFQARVWRELARLPLGEVISYGRLAARVGRPGAARAVGTAMARNPLAWLVPCHRVVRSDGSPGRYQGGSERKVAMLAWEQAQTLSSGLKPPVLQPEDLVRRSQGQGAMADQQHGAVPQ